MHSSASLGSGIFSSSKMKCALPMRSFFPSRLDAIPCARMYSTFVCSSLWFKFLFEASFTTARARECGKCSSRQAASFRTSFSSLFPKTRTSFTTGFDSVRVPVLSNTIVSACAKSSRNFPPFARIPSGRSRALRKVHRLERKASLRKNNLQAKLTRPL